MRRGNAPAAPPFTPENGARLRASIAAGWNSLACDDPERHPADGWLPEEAIAWERGRLFAANAIAAQLPISTVEAAGGELDRLFLQSVDMAGDPWPQPRPHDVSPAGRA